MWSWKKKEEVQDLRSLAVFRVCMGSYMMYDVISRLSEGYLSLLWYVSDGYLDVEDTPHRAPIHRLWFYRGSIWLQSCWFAVTLACACRYALGYRTTASFKLFLWWNVVSMQCRCMPNHDGSDTFLRHLLLWSVFLPVSAVWSLDSYNSITHTTTTTNVTSTTSKDKDSSNVWAVWGIRCQIVLMYLGTVLARTLDDQLYEDPENAWMYPRLSAVYYILHSDFAVRQNWMVKLLRSNYALTQILTAAAMLQETLCPLCCLLLAQPTLPAILLMMLHLHLFLLMNLPNWQAVAILAHTIWIPTSTWQSILQSKPLQSLRSFTSTNTTTFHYWLFLQPYNFISTPLARNKKDLLHPASTETPTSKKNNDKPTTHKLQHRIQQYISIFLFCYMFYDFGGNRGWYSKPDHGDIGESIRFSQYWVMYRAPPILSTSLMLTGTYQTNNGTIIPNVNVWKWISNQNTIETVSSLSDPKQWVHGMTHILPSPRWERAIEPTTFSANPKRKTIFLQRLCVETTHFLHFTFTHSYFSTYPPDEHHHDTQNNQSTTPYQYNTRNPTVITIDCQKEMNK